MTCSDSGAVVFAEPVEMFANPTSGRRLPHHLSMTMIANILHLSVILGRVSYGDVEVGEVVGRTTVTFGFERPSFPRLEAV